MVNGGRVLVINGVTVDFGTELLCDRSGNSIPLRTGSFAVLSYLAGHANRLVTKSELMSAIWPNVAVTDDSLVQCIHEIRCALNDEGHTFLVTVVKRGYRLVLPVETEAVNAAGQGTAVRARQVRTLAALGTGAMALLAVAAATFWQPLRSAAPGAVSGKAQAVAAGWTAGGKPAPVAETANPKAYDALRAGLEFLHRDSEEDTLMAISMFEQAIRLDPRYSQAHAAAALAQLRIVSSLWYSTNSATVVRTFPSFQAHLVKAMDAPTSLSYLVAATWSLQTNRIDEALVDIDKAREIAPDDPEILVTKALLLNVAGRAKEAESELNLAMSTDRYFSPASLRVLSMSLFNQGKYLEAAEAVERLEAQGAANRSDYMTLVSSFGQLGLGDQVLEAMGRFNRQALAFASEPMSLEEAKWYWNVDMLNYHRPYVETLVDGLRKAGIPEGAGADMPFELFAALLKRRPDGAFEVIGATELGALPAGSLFDRSVRFIDVRSHAAYVRGHVPGAINLSLVSNLSKEELRKVAKSDDEIVFYCQSKYCGQSAIAAAKAVAWGYKKVYLLDGGLPAWKDADCPTTAESRT